MDTNPTPWSAKVDYVNSIVISDADGIETATVVRDDDLIDADHARAARIVRAVNTHDEMVAALRPLQAWAENERQRHNARGDEMAASYMGGLADAARAALVKA